jgi:hypothetical protein
MEPIFRFFIFNVILKKIVWCREAPRLTRPRPLMRLTHTGQRTAQQPAPTPESVWLSSLQDTPKRPGFYDGTISAAVLPPTPLRPIAPIRLLAPGSKVLYPRPPALSLLPSCFLGCCARWVDCISVSDCVRSDRICVELGRGLMPHT